MLVSDSFNISLSDDFTPIIEHQDYEIDYAYLSGGERTAIALAYRLSLNQVINSLMSKIKTKDFADKILEHNQSPQGIELAKQLKETEMLFGLSLPGGTRILLFLF